MDASITTDIGEGAKAVTALAGIAQFLLDPPLQTQINKLQDASLDKANKCRDSLLAGDWSAVQLAFDGLPKYVPVSISPSQLSALKSGAVPNFSRYDILGLYCLGLSGKLEADVRALIQNNASPKQ